MSFVPSWRTPWQRRRRRRRLKIQVYIIVLVGSFLICSHIYQNWKWNEFRKLYWAQEELILYDGGSKNHPDNGGSSSSSPNTNQQKQEQQESATPNPHAQWNPTKILHTTRDVKLAEKPVANDNKAASFVRGSRRSNHFSDFVPWNDDDGDAKNTEMTLDQAKEGREPILEIFQELGLAPLTAKELLQVPKWSEIQDLYGEKPILIGMDTCLKYQAKVPPSERYIGVAGSFNTGTTAFGLSLQQNCRFPNRQAPATTTTTSPPDSKPQQAGNIVTNVHGMLNQVPWAKHKMAHERFNHTIDDTIPKESVLPVVLVRDPYFWMQSMCKQGYGVRWDHNNDKHCPNLVPNDYDKKRFKQRYAQNDTSVPVWMGQSYQSGPHWDSLVHYWNDWYGSYYYNTDQGKNEKFPRLMIRFEDTLFHAKTVMKMVCACGGGIFSGADDDEEEAFENIGFTEGEKPMNAGGSFRSILDEAKFEHKHVQNNLVSAIVKYGTDKTRYRNMTREDLNFAQTHLNTELIKAFHYKLGRQ